MIIQTIKNNLQKLKCHISNNLQRHQLELIRSNRKLCFYSVPSFSSKRGHVTEKHVLTGNESDKLGNQTFEVLRPWKRTVYTIPFSYFTYLSHSRHLNHLISEILEQRNTWFDVSAVFVYRKHINEFERFSTLCESLVNGCRNSNVWLPSLSCLRPIRTCFSPTCPRLDENDGTKTIRHTQVRTTCVMVATV